jgi:cardiolipin synthase
MAQVSYSPEASTTSPRWFPVGEDRVRLLRDGREAFPAMLEAIDAAEREVLLEMYWVGADAAGELFRHALTRAATRGVTVRVVYDALGSLNIDIAWWAQLVAAGGEVLEFHPLSPLRREFRLNLVEQRDHRKVLVVDGRIGFTGGINLSIEWLPVEQGGSGWRDDMIAVVGPTAEELRTLFYRTRRRLVSGPLPEDVALIRRTHPRPVWVLASRALPKRLVHREYLFRIQTAKRHVDLANSYFIPERRVRIALARAVARGVRVRVMVPARGDVPAVQFAVEAMFDALLRRGIEIYSMPGPMLHAKTAIIDDEFTTVGSYNLDERSWRKNLEVNLAVLDGDFARHVRKWFEYDLAGSKRIDLATWRTRSWMRRLAEWLALMFRKLW